MPSILHHLALLLIAFATCASQLEPEVEASKAKDTQLPRVTRLCMNADPNGIAVVQDDNKNEILLLFVEENFHVIPVDRFNNLANFTGEANKLMTFATQLATKEYWSNFSAQYVVSFSGQDNTSSFYNNILAFNGQQVLRYRITSVKLSGASVVKLKIEFVNQHSTLHWHGFPSFNDISYMYLTRGSSVLMVYNKVKMYYSTYILTEGDLGNPVERSVHKTHNPVPKRFSMIRHMQRFSNSKYITVLDDGDICIDSSCINIRRLTDCEPQILEFSNSFIYSLQHNTNLTLRLAMITLSSIMVVNFVLALSFIYNQIMRIYELT